VPHHGLGYAGGWGDSYGEEVTFGLANILRTRPIPRPVMRGPAVVASVVTPKEKKVEPVRKAVPVVRRVRDGRRNVLCHDLPETRAFVAPVKSASLTFRPVQIYRAAMISGGEWIDVEAESYGVAQRVAMLWRKVM
jgi:hypothetical protein